MADLDNLQEEALKKLIDVGKNEEIDNGSLFYKTWRDRF